jgi:hypothetical protein
LIEEDWKRACHIAFVLQGAAGKKQDEEGNRTADRILA